MDAKKTVQTLQPLIVPVVIVIVVIILAGPLLKKLRELLSGNSKTTDGLGSGQNLDKLVAGADAEVKSYKASVVPSATSISKANTIHQLFDTFYPLDVFDLFSNSALKKAEALKINNVLVGQNGIDIARTIKGYGARKLPNRGGSLSGVLYDNTYGTLRDHVDRFFPTDAKDANGKNIRTVTLQYIDKVIKDYLT